MYDSLTQDYVKNNFLKGNLWSSIKAGLLLQGIADLQIEKELHQAAMAPDSQQTKLCREIQIIKICSPWTSKAHS